MSADKTAKERKENKMEYRFVLKLNSYRLLAAILASSKAKWASLAAFKRAVTSFLECLEAIEELIRARVDKSGAGQEKALCKQALIKAAYAIASALTALASDTANAALANRITSSRTGLSRGQESEFLAHCENILSTATEYLDALDDEYGVTKAQLTSLQQKIDAFRAVQPKPRRTRAGRKAATDQLRAAFAQAEEILFDKLDNLMMQFEDSEPQFYVEYFAARKLSAPSSRSGKRNSPAPATEVAGPTEVPLPKAA
jgi:hypothetical protein